VFFTIGGWNDFPKLDLSGNWACVERRRYAPQVTALLVLACFLAIWCRWFPSAVLDRFSQMKLAHARR
jgi:hypothetical protein